ncbi:MAG: hypothetical protein PHV18_04370 [Lachnospiraceae bacterium]|nr:hypothetical protein [Lachnospiraceae bacterium]
MKSLEDLTERYAGTIAAFECDFALAVDPENGHGLDELQIKIEQRDQQLLADIELLQELSFELRQGTAKIVKISGKRQKAETKNV